ncbi:protein sax-3-like [Oppia nitens]|uniref:protein sax-3-like n=1 Tax=Oppia nitens TaxID=1686743 RepID=UPI0023D98225|nr:protein sax-3-like [Oppia nitens]
MNEAITKMINPGDRLNIPCSLGLTPGGSVQWVQNGKPILLDFSPTQRRHWNITNDGQTGLTINRVAKIDEGLWECWELDGQGVIKHKALVMRLVVTNIPENPYIEFEGRRMDDHSTLTVRENTVVNVNCVVRGAAPPVKHVYWYLSHQNITEQSKLLMEYSAEEDVSMAISILTINATQDLNNKIIICQVYHVSWLSPATASASFNILYVPAFSITREPGFGYPIIEGMPVSLRCEIDANPHSPAKWHRDAEPSLTNATSLPQLDTDSEGTLHFGHISKSDSGWYKCTTEHEFGYFTSFGYYLNVRKSSEMQEMEHILRSPLVPIKHDNTDDTIDNNNNERIASDGDPNEAALGMKSYDPSKESNNNNNFKLSDKSNISPLSVTSSQHHHQSTDCNNKNSNINIGQPTIEFINRTVIALVGSQITLAARFCCQPRPKKVYWIHRHLALMPQRTIGPYHTRELIMSSDSMNCFMSTFEISSVKPEDSGDVLFIVMNTKGTDEALVSVNVTVASFSISKGYSSTLFGDKTQQQLLLMIMTITPLIYQTLMFVTSVMVDTGIWSTMTTTTSYHRQQRRQLLINS